MTVRPFGDLEAAVMDCLWSSDVPLAVREVLERLDSPRPLAYTTILTVLDNLHRKAAVQREMSGRAWFYAPVRSRAEHVAVLLNDVLDGAGDKGAALLHFVTHLDHADLAELRTAVDGIGDPP